MATERPRSLAICADGRTGGVHPGPRHVGRLDCSTCGRRDARARSRRAAPGRTGRTRPRGLARRRARRVRRRRLGLGRPAARRPAAQARRGRRAGVARQRPAPRLGRARAHPARRGHVDDPWPRRLRRTATRTRRQWGAAVSPDRTGRVRLLAPRRPATAPRSASPTSPPARPRAHRHAADAGPRAGVVTGRPHDRLVSERTGWWSSIPSGADGPASASSRRRGRLRELAWHPTATGSRSRAAAPGSTSWWSTRHRRGDRVAPGGCGARPTGGRRAIVATYEDHATPPSCGSSPGGAPRAPRPGPAAVGSAPHVVPEERRTLLRRARDPRLPVPARAPLGRRTVPAVV